MNRLVQTAIAVGHPPLTITILFIVAYLVVGIPAHLLYGPGARDYFGTIAGVAVSLAYLTLILGFTP
ncbi:hypothetical protein [Burkholderia sp. Ax-1719]|jgi:hypothetical protein|uniref:hypothetical protein n=1 Tax=Burkholderia sp. Ax-1719 TaxID=2608334 RepID=UPI00141F6495|nr:hypothetical protein [Burkholderia sp. Ax-1719]NIE67808.1 hypothetical protein [Burkholderia sp. Ax-1719]